MAALEREKEKLAAFGQVEMLPHRQAAIKELLVQAEAGLNPVEDRHEFAVRHRARRAWGPWMAGAAGLIVVAGGLYVASNTITTHHVNQPTFGTNEATNITAPSTSGLLGSQMHIPTLNEVKTATFAQGSVVHIDLKSQSGRETVTQILHWLAVSKPEGIEPVGGPYQETVFTIGTKNGRFIQITQDFEQEGNSWRRLNNYVVLFGKGKRPVRLYSPQLAALLNSGGKIGTASSYLGNLTSKTGTSRYSALSNVPPSMLATFKQELQNAPVQNIMLPTNLPFTVTSVTEQNIGGGVQIYLSNTQHTLEIQVFAPYNEPVTKFVTLPNEKITSLSDGATALYGYNDRSSGLAWANNGTQYTLSSIDAQHKANLSEQQLISVADSFR